jgi:hypothetical protein
VSASEQQVSVSEQQALAQQALAQQVSVSEQQALAQQVSGLVSEQQALASEQQVSVSEQQALGLDFRTNYTAGCLPFQMPLQSPDTRRKILANPIRFRFLLPNCLSN